MYNTPFVLNYPLSDINNNTNTYQNVNYASHINFTRMRGSSIFFLWEGGVEVQRRIYYFVFQEEEGRIFGKFIM